ncbi:MAG: PQQ-dependent sugar dehydrogenase [Rickettsiales bacterium TMED254]|nr:glucose dehydrogenase [Rickettsiales bacterium]RPF75730.1 MAG: PQQ-dependent sugar dehydrogenase [Rickettsiales bacterium TMED254]
MIFRFVFFTLIFHFFNINLTYSNPGYKDYRKYKKTNTQFKLVKVTNDILNYPWGMTFIDEENILITEKNGRLLKINVKNGKTQEIEHDIQHIDYNGGGNQGGLLDILYHKKYVYFTYSHKHNYKKEDSRKNKNSNTAIARGILKGNKIINLEVLLIGKPKININKHFGSRIIIKGDHLYATFGERGKGMIAQDPTKHPGSIIRINLDGSIPGDNPAFRDYPNWLPEIYVIGVRNPQGITISPHDGEIYFSQHGPMGGDNIGKVKYAGNFGWKDIAWGGRSYAGFSIGKVPFKNKYNRNIITWVPSMAVGNLDFYSGKEFPEWKGDLLVCATKANMLFRLDYKNNKIIKEEFIIKDHPDIRRIRDFEIDKFGNIFLISDDDNSSLWKLSK